MKTPVGTPIMQHQFSVTFNGRPVEGLTDWIHDVSIDYVEQKIGLSFQQVISNDLPKLPILSSRRLFDLITFTEDLTIEVNTLAGDRSVLVTETFKGLDLKELYLGYNSLTESSESAQVTDITCRDCNPVYVSASISYEEET